MAVDPYYDSIRLDLYSFDGSPMMPMYLAYNPPEMLPTGTLHPISSKKEKRQVDGRPDNVLDLPRLVSKDTLVDPDRWLWIGVVMSVMGGVALFLS